jgi:hypothetical protein
MGSAINDDVVQSNCYPGEIGPVWAESGFGGTSNFVPAMFQPKTLSSLFIMVIGSMVVINLHMKSAINYAVIYTSLGLATQSHVLISVRAISVTHRKAPYVTMRIHMGNTYNYCLLNC